LNICNVVVMIYYGASSSSSFLSCSAFCKKAFSHSI
jgi:hypothetical protein